MAEGDINVSYTGQQYVLRASSPMPVYGEGSGGIPTYVLHSFGADISEVDIYECTTKLPASRQFQGQGGNLFSASFSRIDDSSGDIFTGRAVHAPDFNDENALGFNN